MELDYKYVFGIALLLVSAGLFYVGRIDQPTFLGLLSMVLAILGFSFNRNEIAKLKKG